MSDMPQCLSETVDLVQKQQDRIMFLRGELLRIAEGNLGDEPWQANYGKVKEVAAAALAADRTEALRSIAKQ